MECWTSWKTLDKITDVKERKPKAIDLFSGCGGLTLGLKQAGFRVVGAVENDPLAVETYKKNHKRVLVWDEDIRKISARKVMSQLKLKKGRLDLLAGCPPCQGFSTITTLNGRIGQEEQNDLVFDFLRFVRVLRPKAVMLENVPKLAKNRRFRKLRSELKRMGYKLNYDVLNAENYGVPQRRRRLILIAGKGAEIPFGLKAPRKHTVRQAFAKLGAHAKKDALHNLPEKRTEKVKKLIRQIPRNGGSRLALGKRRQLGCHKRCDGFKDVYGRMAWNDVSPTITGGCFNPSKGRFLHPAKNRAITLREAALLQSFPVNYFFSIKRGKCLAAQMIGNALPPEFIKRHARRIRKGLALVQSEFV